MRWFRGIAIKGGLYTLAVGIALGVLFLLLKATHPNSAAQSASGTASALDQVSGSAASAAEQLSSDGMVKHVGYYSNPNYGYSVVIPSGVEGLSAPAPAPHHGIEIDLPDDPAGSLIVDGSYNGETRSLDGVVDYELELLTDSDGSNFHVTSRERVSLGGLPAVRLKVTYLVSRKTRIYDGVLAVRDDPRKDHVMYDLSLMTDEEHYANEKLILDSVAASWKEEPLP